jgi:hypothetical protein
MQDKFTKEFIESARQFARVGLSAASNAVGYAAGVLRDIEKELKESSDRFHAGCAAKAADEAHTDPPAKTDSAGTASA